jgi:exodeoxyribonuclease V alpha subunit
MKTQPDQSSQEVLAGLVERVTFHNAENGFCVLRIKARGHRELITVIGHAAVISAGEWVTASGEWVNDRTHGQQYRARFLKTSAPTSMDGIEKYLGSGMIRGIGPVYAKKLVRAFGETVFDTIEAEPGRLREVTGIGPVRAGRITAAWTEQKVVREIMVFLHSHGVGTARAVRIYKTYGADAVQVMSENPYRLARDIRGFGFKTADAIAMKLGIGKTATIRVRAGISFALTEAMDEGHCGLPTADLVPLAEKLLEVTRDLIRTAIDLELAERTVIADRVGETDCIFLASLYHAERAIADRLLALTRAKLPGVFIDANKAVPWIERRIGLELAPSQRAAVRLALASKVLVITGGPGVGKTTIINAILRILAAKGVKLLLCAPTGRAAKRLSETIGHEAKTIHRLLEVDPRSGRFKRDAENPLDCDLLVVDETSMVDVPLMHALLKAVPESAALLVVGDVDQLPSVGPGQVLADMIASGAVAVRCLAEVFRQAAESQIIVSAHRINKGIMPDLSKPEGDSDFYFVRADDPETAVPRIVELVKIRIPNEIRAFARAPHGERQPKIVVVISQAQPIGNVEKAADARRAVDHKAFEGDAGAWKAALHQIVGEDDWPIEVGQHVVDAALDGSRQKQAVPGGDGLEQQFVECVIDLEVVPVRWLKGIVGFLEGGERLGVARGGRRRAARQQDCRRDRDRA